MRIVLAVISLCFMVACGRMETKDMQQECDSRIVRLAKLEIYEEYLEASVRSALNADTNLSHLLDL